MTIIGVDPGKTGANVLLQTRGGLTGKLSLYPMPVLKSKNRFQYDIRDIHGILNGVPQPRHAFIEKQQPLPAKMGGVSANFFRGYSLALFEGLCHALAIAYTIVAPRSWQRMMLEGIPGDDTKQRAIIAVDRLFPLVDTRGSSRAKKPHLGIIDALLIAEYGHRMAWSPAPKM